MFKPIRWNTFIRDFIIIQLGFAIFGFSIALLIQANLGTSPWVMLTVALSQITGLSTGTMTMLIGVVILLFSLYLKESVGWGTIGNIVSIGPWLDLSLRFVPFLEQRWLLQSGFLLGSALLMGLATAIYIGVDAGAGPRDTLMLAVERSTRLSLRQARGGIELVVLLFGFILGGPIGVGTVAFALLIGPSVQWAFRLLGVKSDKETL